jgi:hypothetical protein
MNHFLLGLEQKEPGASDQQAEDAGDQEQRSKV